jgi:hypothetical protein
MFKQLRKLLTGYDEDATASQLSAMQRELAIIKEQKELTQAQLEAEMQLNAELEAKVQPRSENEPWVEIKSADYNETRGFKIELDWNDAFITYLKDNGLRGKNDEEIVQKWLGYLYGNLIEDLERVSMDKAESSGKTNDFL